MNCRKILGRGGGFKGNIECKGFIFHLKCVGKDRHGREGEKEGGWGWKMRE